MHILQNQKRCPPFMFFMCFYSPSKKFWAELLRIFLYGLTAFPSIIPWASLRGPPHLPTKPASY